MTGWNLPPGVSVSDLPGQGNEICSYCEEEFLPDDSVLCVICEELRFCSVECLEAHNELAHEQEADDEA